MRPHSFDSCSKEVDSGVRVSLPVDPFPGCRSPQTLKLTCPTVTFPSYAEVDVHTSPPRGTKAGAQR